MLWGKILSIAAFMGKYFCPFCRGQLRGPSQKIRDGTQDGRRANGWGSSQIYQSSQSREQLAICKTTAKHKTPASALVWIPEIIPFRIMTWPERTCTAREMSKSLRAMLSCCSALLTDVSFGVRKFLSSHWPIQSHCREVCGPRERKCP